MAGVNHYESTGRMLLMDNFAEINIHLETPITGFEEITLSSGFNRKAKSMYLVNERNGKSMIRLVAASTYSTTSSNMALTISAPMVTSQVIDFSLSHNITVGGISADSKVKLGPLEVLLKGNLQEEWQSGTASIATSFDGFKDLQINWDLTPSSVLKTATFRFECAEDNIQATMNAHFKSLSDVSLRLTLVAPLLGLVSTTSYRWEIKITSS